jgi:hypothetical protein
MSLYEWEIVLNELIRVGYIVKKEPDDNHWELWCFSLGWRVCVIWLSPSFVVLSPSCDFVVISPSCDVVISASCHFVVILPSCDFAVMSPSCDFVVISTSCDFVVSLCVFRVPLFSSEVFYVSPFTFLGCIFFHRRSFAWGPLHF